MTETGISQRTLRGKAGAILLILETAVLVAYTGVLTLHVQASLQGTSVDSIGFLGNLGFASLHAVRTLVFDRSALLCLLRGILVLCSAFVAMLSGVALLSNRTRREDMPRTRRASAVSKGVS